MSSVDFWVEVETNTPWGPSQEKVLNTELLKALRADPLPETSDVAAAEELLGVVHRELKDYGTDGSYKCDDKEIAIAVRALEAVTRRLGIPLELPFRDFTGFKTYWLDHDGYGSWQARRDILEGLFESTYKELDTLESRLAGPKIEEEFIASLRNPAAIREQLARLARTAQSDPH